jgi:hypothetical protein
MVTSQTRLSQPDPDKIWDAQHTIAEGMVGTGETEASMGIAKALVATLLIMITALVGSTISATETKLNLHVLTSRPRFARYALLARGHKRCV